MGTRNPQTLRRYQAPHPISRKRENALFGIAYYFQVTSSDSMESIGTYKAKASESS